MVRKIIHGLETCEECRKIFLLFLEPDVPFIRFNSLLKQCQKTIDPKYSAPRLQRHLKGLVGKVLKRKTKGRFFSAYSIILPKNLDLEGFELEQKIGKLKELPLSRLVELRMRLYRFAGLEQMIADLEYYLNRITSQEHSFRLTIFKIILEMKLKEYDCAIINRSKDEYIEVLKTLKDEKSRLLNFSK